MRGWTWLVMAALLLPISACAPKRLAPVTNSPVPRPPRQATAPAAASDSLRLAPSAATALDSLPAEWRALLEQAAAEAGPPAPGGPAAGAGADGPADGAWPGEEAAALARTQVGKPYGWGATGPERFDCSGLALYVYRQLGIALPRVSADQASTGVHVDRTELRPGDLVFFSLRSAFDHVGIFLGNNRFVHAPRRQEPVRIDNLDDAWWNRAYKGARRVFGGDR
ncbi:MAG: C40 family peptidase [bacterium]|nr:C40 family peptidase [bacterium]